MNRSAEVLGDALMVTVVADCDGDIYERFACLGKQPLEEHVVALPACSGQKKRTAG